MWDKTLRACDESVTSVQQKTRTVRLSTKARATLVREIENAEREAVSARRTN
jgi:hypothetical protein